MSIFGKYNKRNGKIEVDTETGDKIAKGIATVYVAGGAAAVGGVIGGQAAAIGSAAAATGMLYELDRQATNVEIIEHKAPSAEEIANLLPADARAEVAKCSASLAATSSNAEKKVAANASLPQQAAQPTEKAPQPERQADSATQAYAQKVFGLDFGSIKIENIASTGGAKEAIPVAPPACLAKPKYYNKAPSSSQTR